MEAPCSKSTFPLNKEDHEDHKKMFDRLIKCTISLMCAAENGHEQCINTLIQSGADVNYLNSDNCTALMVVARHDEENYVDALTKAGADVNHTKFSGETALSNGKPMNKL